MQSIVRRIRTIGNFENAGGLFVPSAGVDLARNFNGTSDYISSSNPTVVISNFSLSFWALKNAQTSANSFGAYNGDGGANGWGIYIPASSLTPNGLLGGVALVTGSISVTAGAWVHYALTRDNSTTTLWINGVSSATSGSTPNVPTATFDIGANPGGGPDEFWGGSIADVAVWTIKISSTQVSMLASGQRANTVGANANLIDYLPIVGQSPEPDKSGNGFNGVLTGTTIVAGPPSLQPF
jgi:hypothetical protein